MTKIIVLVVKIRSQNHTDRAARKIVYVAPYHRADVKPLIRAIQMKTLFLKAVVEHDVKAARHRDDKLLQFPVPVTGALGSARHVVKIINALDFKRNMPVALDKSQIPARVCNHRQINQSTLFNQGFHSLITNSLAEILPQICRNTQRNSK